jgi:hypothetical protein
VHSPRVSVRLMKLVAAGSFLLDFVCATGGLVIGFVLSGKVGYTLFIGGSLAMALGRLASWKWKLGAV